MAGVFWQGWRVADRLGVVWLCRSILFTHRLGSMRDTMLRQRGGVGVGIAGFGTDEPADEILLWDTVQILCVSDAAAELRRNSNA